MKPKLKLKAGEFWPWTKFSVSSSCGNCWNSWQLIWVGSQSPVKSVLYGFCLYSAVFWIACFLCIKSFVQIIMMKIVIKIRYCEHVELCCFWLWSETSRHEYIMDLLSCLHGFTECKKLIIPCSLLKATHVHLRTLSIMAPYNAYICVPS